LAAFKDGLSDLANCWLTKVLKSFFGISPAQLVISAFFEALFNLLASKAVPLTLNNFT
jgi:hypothetical protein